MDSEEASDDGNSGEPPEDASDLHQPHDKLFAATFEVPENTAALLKAELPADLAAAIDWGTMKHEPGSFVTPGFRRAHTDLLFSAKVCGRDTFIYVLLPSFSKWRCATSSAAILTGGLRG